MHELKKSRNLALLALAVGLSVPQLSWGQTAFGEIEGRPAPVSRRQCIGGANAGTLCNEDADCPGSTCQDRNFYNISVAVRFNATAAQLNDIRDAFRDGSELLFDVTDGQAQFGQVSIFNDSSHSTRGHFWITSTGGNCGADTGSWGAYSGGNITVPMTSIQAASAGGCIAHEFVHLTFDARDEYESRSAGCGGIVGPADCPDAGEGPVSTAEEHCLMTCCIDVGTELCWGQAAGDNVAAGNHDANNDTEQSRCRSNRSCWDQIGWSWPETIEVPAGAPDAGSNGLLHQALVFVEPEPDARLVLVLDRSGSMTGESPSRLDRLKTAALDVVNMAENGIELGIVSFASTATDEVAIATLGADRSTYSNAINALVASGATNIGDGLQHAYNMILAAGGATANTAIILMTDGRNNEPSADPAADLAAKLATLLAADVPVYVTCTGDDTGLNSQCSEIATGTNGTYVDSAEASELPERFVSFYELAQRRAPTTQVTDHLFESQYGLTYEVEVEPGAEVVTFAVLWRNPGLLVTMTVEEPGGVVYPSQSIPLGRFVRIPGPVPGTWTVRVQPDIPKALMGGDKAVSQISDTIVVRSYIENKLVLVAGAVQRRVVQPGEPMRLCARVLDETPLLGVVISGYARTPAGQQIHVELYDDGGVHAESADEIAEDGTYCAAFTDTLLQGAYLFRLRAVARGAQPSPDVEPGLDNIVRDPVDFDRIIELSATVDDREVRVNHRPIAVAGPDQHVTCDGPETAVLLNALASYDPDGDHLSFRWSGSFGSANGAVVEVMLPAGRSEIMLTADDGIDTDTEGLVVTVTCPPTIVFVSSAKSNGDLGGIAGADGTCTQLAMGAGLPGTYKAWLSDHTTHPAASFVPNPGPYVLVDGTPVAADFADLTDGSLLAPINLDENGLHRGDASQCWTGTSAFGLPVDGAKCGGWTATSELRGALGRTDSTTATWSFSGAAPCSREKRLYCFQKPHFAEAQTDERVAFVSSAAFDGKLGGIVGADARCAELAANAGLLGAFKAWLSDSATSPLTSFARHAGPYVRVDGALIANDFADLTDGTLFVPISIDELGNPSSGARVWTATRAPGVALDGAMCADWTTDTLSRRGAQGRSDVSTAKWSFSGAVECHQQRRLYCFQQ